VQLVRSLARQGYAIDIETNGTINFSPYQPYASICMDIKCPSSGGRSDLTFLPLISSGDCVRFVVADRADLEYAARVMRGQPIAGEIFFSPVSGSDPREAANFILERDLPARLQLQLHKFLGVR
jgi:7-carboxy-7-deazaguanine synthase